MYSIDLPLTRCMRLLAASIVCIPACLIGWSSIAVGWRLAVLLGILVTGLVLWRRYRHRRPAVLHIRSDQRLSCSLASGERIEVAQVLPGIIAPSLVMATLVGRGNEVMQLIVPGRSLRIDDHWRLRRVLLAWRCAKDAGTGVPRDQSAERGGT